LKKAPRWNEAASEEPLEGYGGTKYLFIIKNIKFK